MQILVENALMDLHVEDSGEGTEQNQRMRM